MEGIITEFSEKVIKEIVEYALFKEYLANNEFEKSSEHMKKEDCSGFSIQEWNAYFEAREIIYRMYEKKGELKWTEKDVLCVF